MKPNKYLVIGSLALVFGLYTVSTNLEELKGRYEHLDNKYEKSLQVNEYYLQENKELNEALQESFNKLKQNKNDIDELNKENKILKQKVQSYKKELEGFANDKSLIGMTDNGWTYFKLTYYDANEPSTGKSKGDPGYGQTASGRYVEAGVTIAVDTKVIPLDTWVLLKWPDGRIEKRRADDTGSAIQGHDIDYYVPKASLAMGTSVVAVKVLKEGK